MMPKSMDIGKRFFGEKIFEKIVEYLKKDPEANIYRAVEMVEKAPVTEDHKEYARGIKRSIETNPAIRQYIQRLLTELDENVQNHFMVNFFVNASLVGLPRQMKAAEELGCNVPYTILIDPTSKCNLSCTGCWAGEYSKYDSLSFEEVDRIVTEAKDLGIYFIAMSGGEPFMWPHLEKLCRKHSDVAFMTYTNGTLIDEDTAKWMREAGNISPAISIEGDRKTTDQRRGDGVYDTIMESMDNLKNNGIAFGFSVTATNENCEEIFSDQFIDSMIDKGAIYGWSFHYIPIGSEPDFSRMLSPAQRARMAERVREIRNTKPIMVADFWNDGELTGGCIAGGRRYFHINARGDVEPCAFVHFAADTIKGKSLKEVLKNPFFLEYQKHHPFSENMLRPCPLIDRPEKMRSMVSEADVYPTHEGADAILCGSHAKQIDRVAEHWKDTADEKWAQWHKFQPERETEKV